MNNMTTDNKMTPEQEAAAKDISSAVEQINKILEATGTVIEPFFDGYPKALIPRVRIMKAAPDKKDLAATIEPNGTEDRPA
jgi:hypothetical protein